jgi:1-acyl-sn-glycerol-3-phosphate acyltransferase
VPTPVLNLFRLALRVLGRAYFGLELIGVEQIPASGPLIITPNHQTFADPPLVTIPVFRPVHYMAWSRLFDVPVFGRFIRLLRAFPVQIASADPRAARAAVRLLQAGQAVMIFPEGERSPDGGVQRFKPGAFRLAVSLGTPVLPVTIDGGHAAWPPGRVFPRPGRIRITYHAPIHPDPGLPPRLAASQLAERARAVISGALRTVAAR